MQDIRALDTTDQGEHFLAESDIRYTIIFGNKAEHREFADMLLSFDVQILRDAQYRVAISPPLACKMRKETATMHIAKCFMHSHAQHTRAQDLAVATALQATGAPARTQCESDNEQNSLRAHVCEEDNEDIEYIYCPVEVDSYACDAAPFDSRMALLTWVALSVFRCSRNEKVKKSDRGDSREQF